MSAIIRKYRVIRNGYIAGVRVGAGETVIVLSTCSMGSSDMRDWYPSSNPRTLFVGFDIKYHSHLVELIKEINKSPLEDKIEEMWTRQPYSQKQKKGKSNELQSW